MTEYYKWLYGFIFNRTHDFTLTEDILQDTYLCAIANRDKLRDESRMKYWLRGIAENKIRQAGQKLSSPKNRMNPCPGKTVWNAYFSRN